MLRLDRKQYPDASLGLWLPTIQVLLILSKPLALWFGTSGTSMEEGSPLDRYVLLGILGLGILMLMSRHFSFFKTLRGNPWMTLLLGFMLVSIIWSDMPYISFKRWTREFIVLVMACLIATEKNPVKALLSVFRRAVYILIPVSYILIHYFPQYGRVYGRWSGRLMWVGVSTQKNGLAVLCLFGILFLAWSIIKRKRDKNQHVSQYHTWSEAFIIMLAIWLFMGPDHSLTYSATSTATLILVLPVFTGLLLMKRHDKLISANTSTVIMAILIFFGTASAFYGGLIMSDMATIFNRNETLTGRTDIWAYLIPYAMEKPILGYGFGGFWTDAHRAATSSHAHNGYLDIILNIGFLGLILFAVFLMNSVRRAREIMINDFDLGLLWICILLMTTVHNMAESSTTSFTGLFAIANIILLVSVSVYVENRKILHLY